MDVCAQSKREPPAIEVVLGDCFIYGQSHADQQRQRERERERLPISGGNLGKLSQRGMGDLGDRIIDGPPQG